MPNIWLMDLMEQNYHLENTYLSIFSSYLSTFYRVTVLSE